MSEEGLIWENYKWLGKFRVVWCRLEGQGGLGPTYFSDPHPESFSAVGFFIGPFWAGVEYWPHS